MFTITLRLTEIEATILQVFLYTRGKIDLQRGKNFDDVNYLTRGALLLEVAEQIAEHRGRCRPPDTLVPFPDVPPATYTQVVDGLVSELSGRTVESDNHKHWSAVLRRTADQLDKIHQEVNDDYD